jgi:hypothetical protein
MHWRTWAVWLLAPAIMYLLADQFYNLAPDSWGIPFEFLWSVAILSLIPPCQISWLIQETERHFPFPYFGWTGHSIFNDVLFFILAVPAAIWIAKQLTRIQAQHGLLRACLWYAVPSIVLDAIMLWRELG